MRTFITVVAAAAATLGATAALAKDASQQRLVHGGNTFVYTTKQVGDRQVIEGHRYPSGSAFHLVVRGQTVSGVSGGTPIAFKLAEAQGAAGVQVAAR